MTFVAKHTRCHVINGQWKKWHVNKLKLLCVVTSKIDWRASYVAISSQLYEVQFLPNTISVSSCALWDCPWCANQWGKCRKMSKLAAASERRSQKNRKQTNKIHKTFSIHLYIASGAFAPLIGDSVRCWLALASTSSSSSCTSCTCTNANAAI